MGNFIQKTILIIGSVFFVLMGVLGCSEDPLQNSYTTDLVSGTYELEGIQINERYCLVGCIPEYYGNVMSSDTFQVSFPVEITVVENREDTLFFSGLEGADKLIRHLDSNRRAAGNPDCRPYSQMRDCAFARLHDQNLAFDLSNPGGWYQGEGTLSNGEITLTANYFYRGLSVDYKLTGRKQ